MSACLDHLASGLQWDSQSPYQAGWGRGNDAGVRSGSLAGSLTDAFEPSAVSQGAMPCEVPGELGQSAVEDLERQMLRFGEEHEKLLQNLRRHYLISEERSLRAFLQDHPATGTILMDAVKHLHRIFGETTVVQLRADIDESGARTLYAAVIWSGPIREVREALARFDGEWWMSHAPQAGGWLTFTYQLV